ncbi:MAG: ABC transporter ATP-binding protein [Alphaproteobacteria bacterium]|nr:MAG: ABC transporter ATP-binding protein [Alphaproteobacteria bacterium]
MSDAVLILDDIAKHYDQGQRRIEVLDGVSCRVAAGEVVALIGPSGTGKSTLLHIAGLLEHPDRGRIVIDGQEASGVPDRRATRLRRNRLGFVYQFHHLLPEFTALENVAMPLRIQGQPRARTRRAAAAMLEELGLAERIDHLPAQLSGGEQQRVAIARALVHRPSLLLADEPTGNLDEHTADRVMDLLIEQVRRHSVAALIATHNPQLAARADRILRLHEGHLETST